MTHTQTVLRCDGCRIAFLPIAESRNSDRAEPVIRALRDRAYKAGWRRYRATPAAGLGDYCPDCQQGHQALRDRRGATAQKKQLKNI